MDPWDNNTVSHHSRRRDHPLPLPSFSSTLLDHIYRSTDDSMRDKHNRADENRVRIEKILLNRRKTADDYVRSSDPNPVFFKHSSSSSSDSSGFSSSESDSFYRRTRSSPREIHRPKPIRTTVERPNGNKVKSKALKMYSDLKKVKQPISPGGRLATFLNSLFTGNAKKPSKTVSTSATSSTASSSSRSCLSKTTPFNEKTVSTATSSASSFSRSRLTKTRSSSSSGEKTVPNDTSSNTYSSASSFSRSHLTKTTSSYGAKTVSNDTSSTTCSSASSFSRSCLSKTTSSSSEKSKRSVRFCPVNVILDENSKRGGHNNNDERIMEENRRVIEAAKELIRTYRKNKDVVNISHDEEEEEEDDDGASCASSDLFELDNLSAIGIDRYREELPVYETTRIIV